MRVLVITAVPQESAALADGLGAHLPAPVGPYRDGALLVPAWGEIQILVGGVGPAAAAAATAVAIARSGPFDLVVNAGVAGGFPERAAPGAVVLADQILAADLGAESDGSTDDGGRGTGFLPLDAMGFGPVDYDLDATLVGRARDALTAAGESPIVGTVLTVSTVTGPESTRRLAERHPGAVAEAMEGFGVVTATAPWQIPTLELRTISNTVGVRDRHAWDLPGAFAALSRAGCALLEAVPALLRTDAEPAHGRP